MRWIALKLVVAISFCLVGTQTQAQKGEQSASGGARKEIRQNLQAFVQADMDGNAEELARLLTDDVVWLPPGEQTVRGKENVCHYLERHQAPDSLRVMPSRIEVDGDLAILRGTFTLEVGGTTVTGKMTQQWRRSDGRWRIASDIWNVDSQPGDVVHDDIKTAAKESRAAVERFLKEWNTGKNVNLRKALHYPFITVGYNGKIDIANTPDEFETDFERMRTRQNWDHSTFDRIEPIFVAHDKAHYKVTWSRHDTSGKRYVTGEIVYIVTKKNGRWAFAVRSTIQHQRLDQ